MMNEDDIRINMVLLLQERTDKTIKIGRKQTWEKWTSLMAHKTDKTFAIRHTTCSYGWDACKSSPSLGGIDYHACVFFYTCHFLMKDDTESGSTTVNYVFINVVLHRYPFIVIKFVIFVIYCIIFKESLRFDRIKG